MKNLLKFIVLLLIFAGCSKNVDDSNNECSANCTVLKGKIVSLNNEAVPDVGISVKYVISGIGGYTRNIVNTKTDLNGNYSKKFFIKDHELGDLAPGYFNVIVDDLHLDWNKYIRSDNLIGNTTSPLGLVVYAITNRDTVIEQDYYIPKKTYIRINLNNFVPIATDDYFEVQTLYPFGPKVGINDFLDSEYSTGFSGYGNWRASGINSSFNVFVAEGEKNMVRIFRRKDGVNTIEDVPVFVPTNNTIEQTYNY